MMYLYVGSIVAIMCIYISVLIDNCSPRGGGGNNTNTSRVHHNTTTKAYDPESASIVSFGTIKRAHIDKDKVSRTSFYLRVGALGKIPEAYSFRLLWVGCTVRSN